MATLLNLQNQTLRIGLNNDPPYTIMDRFGGIELTIIKMMSVYFNFTIKLVDCHGEYGAKLSNGTWTGLLRKLIDNEIDFGIGVDRLTFATIFPENQINFDLLIRPFSKEIWLCLWLSLSLFLIFQEFKIYFNNSLLMKNTGKKSLNHHHHRANIFYIAIRLLLKQPYQQLRWMKKLEKFCLIIWCMAIIVLHILYGTFLFSTLTIPTKMVIDTVDKLAEECGQNKIIILTQLNSANGKILLESYRRLYDYTENSDDDELALNLLIRQMNYSPKAKQYAVISYRKTLQYYQNGGDEKQLYYIPPNHSGSSISMTWISFPFRNDFKYLQSFNKLLSLYKSSGLIKHWFEREKMKANKFRSLMINTNKKQQYNVPRHYDYHDHKDDSVYAIIRT
ncbi:uncharacterized protein LOC124490250 isoform X2 [Dermatophagoides farinae]|uniref:uncharacterized protein LOC124490250 isoform X2 n=1 Tax=Dermatophagoides farinae TaxID=6954 RepID=UPI003F5F17D3